MQRREFIRQTAAGAAMLSVPAVTAMPATAPKPTKMGIVVHSYASRWQSKTESGTYPSLRNALDLLDHCHKLGAGGIQTIVDDSWTSEFARHVRDRAQTLNLYVEGSVAMPKTPQDTADFARRIGRAREAGVTVVRTVCSNGRRYESYHSDEAFRAFKKNAVALMQAVEPILKKQGVRLAIENHKDWRADELASVMKQLASEWVGVTIDFGNNFALLDDPMNLVQSLAPYVLSTHVKDMAMDEYADGFRLSEVPMGEGVLDLPAMVALCKKYNPAVTFSLEMITRDPLLIPCLTTDYWQTFPTLPATNLAETLRTVRQHPQPKGLPTVSQLTPDERLAAEDRNIRQCLAYSREKLGMV